MNKKIKITVSEILSDKIVYCSKSISFDTINRFYNVNVKDAIYYTYVDCEAELKRKLESEKENLKLCSNIDLK